MELVRLGLNWSLRLNRSQKLYRGQLLALSHALLPGGIHHSCSASESYSENRMEQPQNSKNAPWFNFSPYIISCMFYIYEFIFRRGLIVRNSRLNISILNSLELH
ncbi:unnamed protein product [Orchesella dallaii]|uniref:Uncharacterized protein n=1 Tax=Orchesella dallaii TaxID=48710 RepID=A0ABP1QRP1_9HEXA